MGIGISLMQLHQLFENYSWKDCFISAIIADVYISFSHSPNNKGVSFSKWSQGVNPYSLHNNGPSMYVNTENTVETIFAFINIYEIICLSV